MLLIIETITIPVITGNSETLRLSTHLENDIPAQHQYMSQQSISNELRGEDDGLDWTGLTDR